MLKVLQKTNEIKLRGRVFIPSDIETINGVRRLESLFFYYY